MDVLEGEMAGGFLARFDFAEGLLSPLFPCFQFGGHHYLSVRLLKNPCGGSEEPPHVVPKLKIMMASFVSLGVSARHGSLVYTSILGQNSKKIFFWKSVNPPEQPLPTVNQEEPEWLETGMSAPCRPFKLRKLN